jgi:hypothetical protein
MTGGYGPRLDRLSMVPIFSTMPKRALRCRAIWQKQAKTAGATVATHRRTAAMSLQIDTKKVEAVLLADGWHQVQARTFRMDSYQYVEGEREVPSGGSGVPFMGGTWMEPNGTVVGSRDRYPGRSVERGQGERGGSVKLSGTKEPGPTSRGSTAAVDVSRRKSPAPGGPRVRGEFGPRQVDLPRAVSVGARRRGQMPANRTPLHRHKSCGSAVMTRSTQPCAEHRLDPEGLCRMPLCPAA